MAFDRLEVEKVAQLARLHISDAEAQEVTSRINDILDLIDRMQSVDTENVEPLAYPRDVRQRLRPDEITETDRREELQRLAPAVESGLFLVPKVLD
ncbi:MAG: Asp-tRNA(Asn)/Glu-tRNA(Gln) amidotransferase subunit GatC [Gammaproteobacteria bacterium]|nr:Asp-tRNA(Asn)/Glu-tRNA(Gln) amidotransferase subunit GatC [Gammaproteobacteria bacterium]MCY4356777.1 Asp-tRNA(Asn)/Glu-tRNA(Gln) amidotransferase subunit GatC [Gammaproteobacteria bacterium]